MSDPFRSSDEYAEHAHQLYLSGKYDETLSLLRYALELFPLSAELNVALGYARLARDEVAWARAAFEEALALEPNQEDALAGLGETLLKLGSRVAGLRCFDRVRALGYEDDHDLMMQIGRALFREGIFAEARRYFEVAAKRFEDSAEVAACLGYAAHRLGDDAGALHWLRRALELEPNEAEARIYLGNLLYDRGEYNEALYHYGRTVPADHIEALALWRIIELRKLVYRVKDSHPDVRPWVERIHQLAAEMSADDRLLAEIEATRSDGTVLDPHQLDFFGTALTELQGMRRRGTESHRVAMADGTTYMGTWEDIVLQMKQDDREWAGSSMKDYMTAMVRRRIGGGAVDVPPDDAESFLRAFEAAGLLRING